MANTGKLVVVQWYDAWGRSRWTDNSEVDRQVAARIVITSCGWIKSSTEDGVCLVSSYCKSQDESLMIQYIPKGCILSVTPVPKHDTGRYMKHEEKF